MTEQEHLEVSRKLALAIGWPENKFWVDGSGVLRINFMFDPRHGDLWNVFDYRDWNVIGPIAERFDCFPSKYSSGEWVSWMHGKDGEADTPQLAIALAVIGVNHEN